MTIRPRGLLVVLAILGGIALAVAGYSWLNRPATTDITGPDAAGTVILIPGYGGGADALSGLASSLQAQGRRVVIADIGDGHGDIGEYGRQVATLATTLTAQGDPSVDLVGYSMGGLVARAAAAEVPQRIRRVATVASPHDGTSVAGLGAFLGDQQNCPTACQQMAPGSAFLDALPVAGDTGRWLSAWSADDDVVRPAESSDLLGATDVEVASACGTGPLDHGGIIASPVTWDLVATFLATGRVTASCSP